jgi:hypothetical protein
MSLVCFVTQVLSTLRRVRVPGAGFAGLKDITVAIEAVGMCEILKGFPRGVGRVESRLHGFPYPGISMA